MSGIIVLLGLAASAALLAAVPGLLLLINLRRYRPPAPPTEATGDPAPGVRSLPGISVLIPARDEEAGIGAALAAALAAAEGVDCEVLVLDDHSTDRTAALVAEVAAHDGRVRLERAPELPAGWNGKQHACWVLSQRARHELLLFVDADVRLEPGSLAALAHAMARHPRVGLLSGAPRQELGSFGERLIVPLITWVLLAFLPLGRMRRSTHPAYAAGIGQLFCARRAAYDAAGGHAAIRATRHDGLKLPAAFRRAGWLTDLVDATPLARCRMYHSSAETVAGFAKNADEGLGAPALIVPSSLLLLCGQVLPWVLAAYLALAVAPQLRLDQHGELVMAQPVSALARAGGNAVDATVAVQAAWQAVPVTPQLWLAALLVAAALLMSLLPRLVAGRRFGQPLTSGLLHPLGVLALVAIQWYALLRRLAGKPATWKGRRYQVGAG